MKNILFLFSLFFISCAHKDHASDLNSQEKNNVTEEFDLSKTRENQKKQIKLLPHQTRPIDYLLAHPEQKGLLINHGLGTGKTFLSLGYCEQQQERQVYILIPQSLKSNWVIQMEEFGVKSKSHYHIISFKDAVDSLANHDFKNDIVIIDEAHRFVELVRFGGQHDLGKYANFYSQIQKSYKILLLTGTPIYIQSSDLAYHFNLVAGEEVLPFNQERFRNQYTSIDYNKSYWRGHLSESVLLKTVLPIVSMFALMVVAPPAVIFPGMVAAGAALPLINANYSVGPQGNNQLRYLNVQKLKNLSQKYVSFYEVNTSFDLSQFPTTTETTKEVDYSRSQIDYYLDLLDKRLDSKQLSLLLDESTTSRDFKNGNLYIQSSTIQEDILKKPGAGREIGNFSLNEKSAPKFDSLKNTIQTSKGPVVVYSSYFENGILKLSDFLTQNKMDHEILNPYDPIEKQISTLKRYNQGQVSILLLHPEFTEGISLHGTAQLHILEPIMISQLFKQIKGRVVRYKSHAHLSEDLRKVDLYIWKSAISYWQNINHHLAVKENWQRYYSELSDYSEYGQGLIQVDLQYPLKKKSPDTMIQNKATELDNSIKELKELFKDHNIDTQKISD